MKKSMASSIIKLVSVFIMFVGALYTSLVFLQLKSMESAATKFGTDVSMTFEGPLASFGEFAYSASGVIILWGFLLFILNRPLAGLIANE